MKNVRSKEEIEAMLKGLEMQREYLWITGENQQQFDALNVSIDKKPKTFRIRENMIA